MAPDSLGVASAKKALIENLAHGFAPVRREAARALAKLGSSAAIPALQALATDIDPLVRAAAAEALRAPANELTPAPAK